MEYKWQTEGKTVVVTKEDPNFKMVEQLTEYDADERDDPDFSETDFSRDLEFKLDSDFRTTT